jgi:tryptophanyl-tRNA synthetase
MTQPRLISGIQATGSSIHLGNYLGAIKQWVQLQQDYEALYFIPDQHSITAPIDPAQLRENTLRYVAQLLALGLDPAQCTMFVQSHVPANAQLAWVLSCLTGFGEASRMTQFKDKSDKQGEQTSVGLFTYPCLMAADILAYQAELVPVGEDQSQHLELTRNLAERFNHRFGETFVVPKARLVKAGARVYDLREPTKKMSKSASSEAGIVHFMDDPKVSAKKFRSAVTDNDGEVRFDPAQKPGLSNLLSIFAALTDTTAEEVALQYQGGGYGALKVDLAEAFVAFAAPVRERTLGWLDNRAALDRILAEGGERAREIAGATVARVYEAVGFLPDHGRSGRS